MNEPAAPPPAPWAVILGASTGTGAAIARSLASRNGMNVYGVHRGRKPEAAAEVERDIRAAGREAWFSVGEAGTADAAARGVEALHARLGGGTVSVFVHSIANASLGSLARGPTVLEPWQYAKTFGSMAHSFAWWARELHAAGMLAPSARLLALGNPVTDSLARDLGLIAAAKAALEIYVRQLAIELGPLGHRVNLLKFGLVETRASQAAFTDDGWPAVRDAAERVTPARRLGTVEEVARFVSVLAGPDAEWFNGASIDFTGGMVGGLLDLVHHPGEPPR